MNYNLLTIFVSFLSGLILISLFKKISFKFGIFRQSKGVSYLGGIAIFVSFVIAILTGSFLHEKSLSFDLWVIIIFALFFLILEFFDDLKDFSLRARIIVQFLLMFTYLFFAKKIEIYFFPNWLNYILSFFWIMGITNAFNLLDIKDGLCGGVALIIALFFALIALLNGDTQLFIVILALIGSLCAFLVFNLPPAKVYMGNSGSHFLGFVFAALSMRGDYATLNNPASILIPILLLAFPIIDTTYLTFQRIRKRILPLRKSDDHIFMHLLNKGKSHKKMLFVVYLLSFLWCMSALFLIKGFNYIFLFSLSVSLIFSLTVIFKANQKEDNKIKL